MVQLTPDQLQFFEENGYLAIPGYFTEDTVVKLKSRMQEILSNFEYTATKTIFTTGVRMITLIKYLLFI